MNDTPDLNTIVGTVGRVYGRFRLSPPYELHRAAQHWVGVSLEEIVGAVEDHLEQYRHLYCGSGDAHFGLVQTAIAKLQDRHGVDLYARGEVGVPEPPARRRRVVRKLYIHGVADAFDDREDSEADVSRLNAPQPYLASPRLPRVTVANLEDDVDAE